MMQDNSFDKNIKHTLEGLNITPSPSVWNEVEKELDRKKRRYFFLWWLLPILIIGGGIFLYTNDKQQTINYNKTTALEKQVTRADLDKTVTEKPNPEYQEQEKSTPEVSQLNVLTADKVNAPLKSRLSIITSVSKTAAHKAAGENEDEHIKNDQPRKRYLQGKTTVSIKPSTPDDDEAGSAAIAVSSNDSGKVVNHEMMNKPADSIEVAETAVQKKEEPKTLATDKPDSLLTKKSVKKEEPSQNNWEKKWTVGGGYAGLGTLKIGASANEALFNSGAVNNPGSGSAIRISNQYSFNNGLFLQAGFIINRTIGKKLKLSSGLQYSFQHINVNRKYMVDSVALTGSPNYTNLNTTLFKESLNIHAIDIPLILNIAISRRVSLNTGILNRFQFSDHWNKYEEVLGSKKTYLPMFHLNPEYNLRKISIGPVVNIGLSQYNNESRLLNVGLSLKYSPKK